MAVILPFPNAAASWPSEAASLPPAERLVLGGLRRWVAAFRRGADPRPELAMVMEEAGGPRRAAVSVDALLCVAARSARRLLDVRCPACPAVSLDEARLLHAARLAQRGEPEEAEAALRPLLTDAGASFAVGPLEGLGELLAGAGLRLRSRRLPDEHVDGAHSGFEAWAPPPRVLQ